MNIAAYNVYNRVTGKPVILGRPGSECAHAMRIGYETFMGYAADGGNASYIISRNRLPEYSRIEVGEKIRIAPEFANQDSSKRKLLLDGVICYLHPENRFFVVDFGGIREAFQMGDLHG